jgi:tripartite-type tricarboxylate transporter receptor subunit TctC
VALLVNPRVLPVTSLDELVARARDQPVKLNFIRPASALRIISEWTLKHQLGMDIVHVPYRGSPLL